MSWSDQMPELPPDNIPYVEASHDGQGGFIYNTRINVDVPFQTDSRAADRFKEHSAKALEKAYKRTMHPYRRKALGGLLVACALGVGATYLHGQNAPDQGTVSNISNKSAVVTNHHVKKQVTKPSHALPSLSPGAIETSASASPSTAPTAVASATPSAAELPSQSPSTTGKAMFRIATSNFLGNSHTGPGGDSYIHVSGAERLPAMFDYFKAHNISIIGGQEFQLAQYQALLRYNKATDSNWMVYPTTNKHREVEDAIIWDPKEFEPIHKSLLAIPYFHGRTRYIPYILFKHIPSGKELYEMNTHNAADVHGPAAIYRARATSSERAKIVELRATSKPVFATGDFNDKLASMCKLTAANLMQSSAGESWFGNTCKAPIGTIDWIFGTPNVKFTDNVLTKVLKNAHRTDHPLGVAEAELLN